MKNRNILFITHTYTTFQKSQIDSVAKYFNKVYVLVRYKPIAEISRFLPLRFFRSHSKAASISDKNKPENVHIYPVPIFYFPLNRSYLKLGDRLFRKTKKIIEKNSIKFDLIHAHYIWTSGYVAIKLKEVFNTPVIITNHSTLQLTGYLKRNIIWQQKMSDTILNADHIFVVNSFMKRKILEVDKKVNVEIIPVGFDRETFFPIEQEKARKRLAIPPGVPLIINISRLDYNKNLELFIMGCAEILKEYHDLMSLIIGEGTYFNRLQKLINDLGLKNNIQLTGMVPHHDISFWINASDFVVLTSFSEGSPTVMYESLACGKPFLGSAVGGIPEIINQDDYGYVFDPYNLSDFVDKLEKMLEKKWDRGKILAYGDQFSQNKISDKIVTVYGKLLENDR
jgi:glycosyltransferase involved in cell wall biosynthesis